MSEALPPPLTSPDCDLRDFRYMPLDVVRFTQSDLVSTADPEAVVAAIRLWAASWHQVPAGSLTDDDRTLSQLAGYGRAVSAFLAVKEGALRGFVKCNDGRLYHPVVAEKARESFLGKLRHRHRTFTAAVRKHNERCPADRRASPSFEEWLELGRPEKVSRDTARPELRQEELHLGTELEPERARTQRSAGTRAHTVAETVPTDGARDMGGMSRVTDDDVTRDKGGQSHESHAQNRSKGEGEGRDRERDNIVESPKPPLSETTDLIAEVAGVPMRTDRQRASAEQQVQEWLDDGIDVERIILPAIRRVIAKKPDPTRSLKRFDATVRHDQAKARASRPAASAPSAPVDMGPDDPDPRLHELRNNLRTRCGARTYDGWIRPGRFTLNGSGVIVTMPSHFMTDWLHDHFGKELAEETAKLNLGTVNVQTLKTAKG